LLTCDGILFALHRPLRNVWMLWNLMLLISWCTPEILKKNMIKQSHGLRQNTVYVVSFFNISWELFVLQLNLKQSYRTVGTCNMTHECEDYFDHALSLSLEVYPRIVRVKLTITIQY
jgi:hypothetical protein